MTNETNEQYIIKREGYTELNSEEAEEHGLYNPQEEPRPKYRIPALVNGEPAWVVDSSNMYMNEMLNWRSVWQCGDWEHGLSDEEYVAYPENERRDMARFYAVDANPDFDEIPQTYYTDDTIEEIIDILVAIWDGAAEYALDDGDD
jgi:hypothetical protein